MIKLAEVKAELKEVTKRGEHHEALIKLTYLGKEYELLLCKLSRTVSSISAEVSGEYLTIKLVDEKGEAFGSCCVHVKHLEKGCLECPSLVVPPKECRSE